MDKINTYIQTIDNEQQFKGVSGTNTDAHYSTDMKLKPPKVSPNAAILNIKNKNLYSDRSATERLQQFNNDIYERQKKEEEEHGFSFKNYFKVFCGVILTAASIAGIRKIIRWFKGK